MPRACELRDFVQQFDIKLILETHSWPTLWANSVQFSFEFTAGDKRERCQVGPEVGPTSAVCSGVPTGMHGPACVFWTNLTAFSLDSVAVLVGRLAAGGLVVGDNRRLRVLTFYSAQVCGASRNTGPRRKLYRVDSNCEAWPRNLTENPY